MRKGELASGIAAAWGRSGNVGRNPGFRDDCVGRSGRIGSQSVALFLLLAGRRLSSADTVHFGFHLLRGRPRLPGCFGGRRVGVGHSGCRRSISRSSNVGGRGRARRGIGCVRHVLRRYLARCRASAGKKRSGEQYGLISHRWSSNDMKETSSAPIKFLTTLSELNPPLPRTSVGGKAGRAGISVGGRKVSLEPPLPLQPLVQQPHVAPVRAPQNVECVAD